MERFLEALQTGRTLIADGATGTNLQARGLPRGLPSEIWLFEAPEAIIRLHADFIAAGAHILLTNSFGGCPLRLEATALKGRVKEVNQRAVELARQAAGEADVWVAGSLGPCGALLKPYGPLEEDAVLASYAAQAQALTEAGADLLVVETQFDLKEAELAVRAVRSVSQLPLVCSFSFDRGRRTMMGVSPSQMAEFFSNKGVDMLGINCGRSLEDNLAALKELRQATDLPIWFKPNAGMPGVDEHGNTFYPLTPQEMGAQVPLWLEAGAQVVGGCCGTSPAHLQSIYQAVIQKR